MTAVVTGAAGGIGGAGYRAFAGQGLELIGHDAETFEGPGTHLVGDIRDTASLDELGDAVRRAGHITTVVAAHGIEGPGRIEDITDDAIRRIMEVNFETVVHLWDQVRPSLEESRGSFVVIASQAGLISEKGGGIYCASKSALRGWLRGIEESTSVRLRLLHPGGVRTPLLMRALDGMAKARGTTFDEFLIDRYADTPATRIAEPEEAGDAIAWAAGLRTPRLVELAITGGEVLW